jgi:hypothetical protein
MTDMQLTGYPTKAAARREKKRYEAAIRAIGAQAVFSVSEPKWRGTGAGHCLYVSPRPDVTDADLAQAKERLLAFVRVRSDDRRLQDCRHKAAYADPEIAAREARKVKTRYGYEVEPYLCPNHPVYHLRSVLPVLPVS